MVAVEPSVAWARRASGPAMALYCVCRRVPEGALPTARAATPRRDLAMAGAPNAFSLSSPMPQSRARRSKRGRNPAAPPPGETVTCSSSSTRGARLITREKLDERLELTGCLIDKATQRRVHAAQKDRDMPPVEAILAPLEAELKLAWQEIAKLQDEQRALRSFDKTKEGSTTRSRKDCTNSTGESCHMVYDMQNKNQELMKRIKIYQEENKTLYRFLRQKVISSRKT